ncbi:probable galacturonosyltransferase 6 isoform X2 [Macadamia integrifolia]|uniref:probable galacturonosyltransferase 6 isoform X2 n=1 Tax=Macadamia integrifolia TaxID=60698 RepID=UPI001C532C1E|nr:probable galacturonosyltransferase 6 isoform X2 [Macadamia integrifolia]
MKQDLRCQRILILSLLSVCVVAPIVIVSNRLKNLTPSAAHKELIEDLSTIKYRADTLKLNSIKQETGQGLKEPTLVVYKDEELNSVVSENSSDQNPKPRDSGRASLLERHGTDHDHHHHQENQRSQQKIVSAPRGGKGKSAKTTVRREMSPQTQRATDEKIREMKDQVIRAKAFLNFAPPNSNSHLVKELKFRIKEVEQAVGEATKDTDLPRSALQKMRSMETSLSKASRVYTDCSAMATKLRSMTYNAEEQVRAHKSQATYLVELAARTTPKGLHCLSMRLTSDYFALLPEERELPNQHKLHDSDLYHFSVFSDNVLACTVVVNSTISSSMEPRKIVFHVVTDALNLPAITMWFLLNPPGEATIEIQSMDNFEWLSSKYNSTLRNQYSPDPRYSSALNHLRFYLPEVFPELNKVVFLDHDVVVQKDLKELWRVNMKGKINGAVMTCQEGEPSFYRMDLLINFSDPTISKTFDATACTWAFGMNLFDLQEWRRQDLTAVYHEYLQLGNRRQLWKDGSLPLGLVTFYNRTVPLDPRWHILGLGSDLGVRRSEIERAAVIHYDGNMKPWLDIAIAQYKGYWTKYLNYDDPYLQHCYIHE